MTSCCNACDAITACDSNGLSLYNSAQFVMKAATQCQVVTCVAKQRQVVMKAVTQCQIVTHVVL